MRAAGGTRVLLDLGMPLTAPDGGDFPRGTPQRPTEELIAEGVLRDVPGVFPHDPTAPAVAAIVLTHSHLDHYGLAHHAHPAIPVYGSEGTIAILEVGRVFFPDAALPPTCACFPTDETLRFGGGSTRLHRDASPSTTRRRTRARCSSRPTGSACSTPATCAPTAAPASASRTCSPTSACAASTGCSCEGTTLGSSGGTHGLRSRGRRRGASSLELARGEPDKLIAVAASGQNLDRLVSCFRAARRSGRQLVVDAYQAYVLMQLAPLSPSIPQVDWDGVRVKLRAAPGRAPQGGRPHGPRPRDERAGPRLERPSSPRSRGASSCARAAAAA